MTIKNITKERHHTLLREYAYKISRPTLTFDELEDIWYGFVEEKSIHIETEQELIRAVRILSSRYLN